MAEITAETIIRTARRLGIELDHLGDWYDSGTRCGCAAGVAAIALDPALAEVDLYPGLMRRAGLTPAAIAGLSDGFEGDDGNFTPFGCVEDAAEYRRHFEVGRRVADLAGLGPAPAAREGTP